MTDRLYYTDAYLTTFRASVVDVADGGARVYLDRTALYVTFVRPLLGETRMREKLGDALASHYSENVTELPQYHLDALAANGLGTAHATQCVHRVCRRACSTGATLALVEPAP